MNRPEEKHLTNSVLSNSHFFQAKMIESGGHGGWMGAAAAATGAASVAGKFQV